MNVIGTMDCSGDASFNNVFLRNNLNVVGVMDCSGDASFNNVFLRKNLNVVGTMDCSGDTSFNNVFLRKNLNVVGTMDCSGDASFNNVFLRKNLNVVGTMDCSGSAKFKDVSMNGNVDISGNLTIMSGYKTRLRDTSVNNLDVSGQLIIRNDREHIRMIGNGPFLSGYSHANVIQFEIGKQGITDTTEFNKTLVILNYLDAGIKLQTGRTTSDPTIYGKYKIETNSTGILIYRDSYFGEIGATNPLDNFLRINGNGTNSIALDSGLGAIYNGTNAFYVGVDSTPVNGNTNRKSNIYMLDAAGTAFEIQSSAFTEVLKSKILTHDSSINDLYTKVGSTSTTTSIALTGTARISTASGDISSSSGNIKTSTGFMEAASFNATSDYRIKQNVQSIDASDTILNLNPQKYLKNDKLEYGFLAHEIQETFPTLVTGEKDGKEMQTLNYLGLISILVKDVQRLHQKINELENIILKKNEI